MKNRTKDPIRNMVPEIIHESEDAKDETQEEDDDDEDAKKCATYFSQNTAFRR